jgi:hypothetical protein
MSLPGFSVDAVRSVSPTAAFGAPPVAPGAVLTADSEGALVPQFAVCTPCVGLPSGPWCFSVFGHRICLPVPYFGSWKGCCDVNVRWWPPGISVTNCGVQRCG